MSDSQRTEEERVHTKILNNLTVKIQLIIEIIFKFIRKFILQQITNIINSNFSSFFPKNIYNI